MIFGFSGPERRTRNFSDKRHAKLSWPTDAQHDSFIANATERSTTMTNATNTYLAIFLGSKSSPKMAAWNALSEEEQRAKMQEGMAGWKAWMEKHQSAIVSMGGPLGKTKRISEAGIEDISNVIGAFTVVRADSHEEAASLFENHPHFALFPGEAVEVMPVMPIPGS
jgi:hypothetical protein